MSGANDDPVILRMVALRALGDARERWRDADARPTETNLRLALSTCVFAARALRRASSANPDEEDEMLDRAMLLDEAAVQMSRRLAQLTAR